LLTIRLKDPESTVKVQVRYVLPSPEGKWMAGCAFLEELSEKELQDWLRE
jgi:hypothetical protein